MIEITDNPINPEEFIEKVKTPGSGCAIAYVGLIRDNSRGKPVLSVEYRDDKGTAAESLGEIAAEAKKNWRIEDIAICHRVGKLNVGDINLVIAVSSGHRQEAFAACAWMVDRFKDKLPTSKTETYTDGTTYKGGE
jgi:molybdopterin synthase catalytic subunit